MNNEKLMKNWKVETDSNRNEFLVFKGNLANFNEWKKAWFEEVPRCEDFSCCHELMSCGIHVACGSCSILNTMKSGNADRMCHDVNCIDCCRKEECIYGHLPVEKLKEYELSFIPVPPDK